MDSENHQPSLFLGETFAGDTLWNLPAPPSAVFFSFTPMSCGFSVECVFTVTINTKFEISLKRNDKKTPFLVLNRQMLRHLA